SPDCTRASGPALGNLGVPFRRIVRGPPARRWAILECRFAGLYAPRRTEQKRRYRARSHAQRRGNKRGVCEGKPNVNRIRKCVISTVIHGKDPEVSV
ncbi:MAG: hypothetical protein ACLQS0_16905, partial [Syntrophobacteraceae bacterium]